MTEQFTRWDSAEYLKTEEDMANYLGACMEEAGEYPAFIAKALGTIARACGMRAYRSRFITASLAY